MSRTTRPSQESARQRTTVLIAVLAMLMAFTAFLLWRQVAAAAAAGLLTVVCALAGRLVRVVFPRSAGPTAIPLGGPPEPAAPADPTGPNA